MDFFIIIIHRESLRLSNYAEWIVDITLDLSSLSPLPPANILAFTHLFTLTLEKPAQSHCMFRERCFSQYDAV